MTGSGARAYTRNGHIEVGPEGELTRRRQRRCWTTRAGPCRCRRTSTPTITENGEVFADNASVGRLGLFRIDGGAGPHRPDADGARAPARR